MINIVISLDMLYLLLRQIGRWEDKVFTVYCLFIEILVHFYDIVVAGRCKVCSGFE